MKALLAKNIIPLREKIASLPDIDTQVEFGDTIKIESQIDESIKNRIIETAIALKPWRKGPFNLFGTQIDSEWNSYIKYNLIKEHIDAKGKDVADIGCNNGYYMLKLLPQKPKSITGFDPGAIFYCQFEFLDRFIKSGIKYELLGIEDVASYEKKFDLILCLGVLYHRSDPIGALKNLYTALNQNGELIIDSLVLEGDDELCLCPKESYAKMKNVYFLPTISSLINWLEWANFKDVKLIATLPTTPEEQRKTAWIDGESLESFVDFKSGKTTEGYPLPIRAYLKAKKQ